MEIERSVIERVVAHARAVVPDECCGILLGASKRIIDAVRAANVAPDPARHYLIDPKAHLDARRDARRRGLEVVGFYHSHPGSEARPSDQDVLEATYPGLLYLIVGLGSEPPQIRIYRFDDGNFREVPFVPVT